MAWKWKIEPVWQGVEMDFGDTSYNPITNKRDVYHSTKLIPQSDFDRIYTRDYMRSIGMNPYDYSGSERKALRTYLNNLGSMDSKYQPFINWVQNQRTQKMVNSIGTNQLLNQKLIQIN